MMSGPTLFRLALATLLLALFGSAAWADVYRWVDQHGNTQYGDKPPPGAASERVRVTPLAPPPDEGELRRRQLLEQADQDARRRLEEQRARAAEEQAQREAQAARAQRCLAARMQLAMLRAQLPVYRDEQGKLHAKWLHDSYQGERDYLGDAERKVTIEQTWKDIHAECRHPDDPVAQEQAHRKWVRAERCAAARTELADLKQAGPRTSPQDVRDKQEEVDRFCNDAR